MDLAGGRLAQGRPQFTTSPTGTKQTLRHVLPQSVMRSQADLVSNRSEHRSEQVCKVVIRPVRLVCVIASSRQLSQR